MYVQYIRMTLVSKEDPSRGSAAWVMGDDDFPFGRPSIHPFLPDAHSYSTSLSRLWSDQL
jgi:hypothetical protein